MLANLQRSLSQAFGDNINVCPYAGDMLAIRLDGIELVIDRNCRLFGMSRVCVAGLEVDVNGLSGCTTATNATV